MKKIVLVIIGSILLICGCVNKQADRKEMGLHNKSFYVTPEQFGAKGDRISDDTLAIQKAINSFGPSGGMVWLAGKYLVDSNDIILRSNITLLGRDGMIGNPGTGNKVSNEEYIASNGQIVLNPAYKIVMNGSSSIKGVMFWRKGLVIPEPDESKFAGVCIDIKGEDCYIGYSLLLGFHQGIFSQKQQRLRVQFVQGDCVNGIWIDSSYDIATITNCHFWPFISAGIGKGFLRDGVAYKFTGASDMTKVINCFSYDHKIGFQSEHSAGMVFSFCNSDGTPLIEQEPPTTTVEGSIGYDVKGYARGIRFVGCEAWGKRIGFRFEPENSFNIGKEKYLPITMEGCKTELVVDGVKSNCDLMMNGCDIRGIGIKAKGHYGIGLEVIEGSSAQINGCRFIDWDIAIKKPVEGDILIGTNRYVDCNNQIITYSTE